MRKFILINKNTPKKSFIKIFSRVILIIITLTLIVSGVVFYNFYSTTPEINIDKLYAENTTRIYDINNELIAEVGIEKRNWVEYEDISTEMIAATIAVEDEIFFQHHGVDFQRVLTAVINNILDQEYSQGASTITQQLIKNTHLTREKTIKRKVQEIILALELEKQLSKEEILEIYLNRVLFTGQIYGVERASNYFFGKSASELDLSEAAILAGMIQKPGVYNPYKNPEETIARRNLVLDRMVEVKSITEAQADKAKEVELDTILVDYENSDNKFEIYSSYVDYVIVEASKKYNLDLFDGGIEIFTSFDPSVQEVLYDLEKENQLNFKDEQLQLGIAVIDNHSGQIAGIYGGRNSEGSMTFNYATDARRQPGSTIKPLLDYAPAIEYLNWSTAQPLLDEKMSYDSGNNNFIQVVNWDDKYKGWVTLRQSLIESRNIPAIKAFSSVPNQAIVNFGRKLGLPLNDYLYPASALGGFSNGFTVLEMTSAFSTFANNGVHKEPYAITKIITPNQTINTQPTSTKVMKPETAYLINDVLHDNMIHGTARFYNVNNMYLAGKTGQSNYDEATCEEYNFPEIAVRDAWFIGYSTDYTVGVWTGYPKITTGAYLDTQTKRIPLKAFNKVMKKINPTSNERFIQPENVVSVNVEIGNDRSLLPNEYTPSKLISEELFIKGTEPTEVSTQYHPLQLPENITFDYNVNGQILSVNFDTPYINYKDKNIYEQVNLSEAEINQKVNSLTGNYIYVIYGVNNGELEEITTISRSNEPIKMGYDQFLQYESFAVKVDYERYRDALNSPLSDYYNADVYFTTDVENLRESSSNITVRVKK